MLRELLTIGVREADNHGERLRALGVTVRAGCGPEVEVVVGEDVGAACLLEARHPDGGVECELGRHVTPPASTRTGAYAVYAQCISRQPRMHAAKFPASIPFFDKAA